MKVKSGYDKCTCGTLKRKKSIQCYDCRYPDKLADRTYKFYKDKYPNWWTSRTPIAKHARRVYDKSNKLKACLLCGYNKHIEVCHIKGVAEFNENTTIKEINHIDNLVGLCRNCHWELDNNLITLRVGEKVISRDSLP